MVPTTKTEYVSIQGKPMHQINPEIDQDRVEDTIDHFNKFGYVMFPQQVKIYENIKEKIGNSGEILEAGCGNGLGTAILGHSNRFYVYGTDKLGKNIKFASCLYPWIKFREWDINYPYPVARK
ncbi:unnamed protein product, partial [marine sediment metagenome]